MKLVNTPYDDVFRTLLNDCCSLMIPVINEVFGERYTGKEKIRFLPNEHFLNQQGGSEREVITDSCFQILGTEAKMYHWECQSSDDSSMLIRFFEYDAQIALDEGEIQGQTLTVTFPYSAVLFLRCGALHPEKMDIKIVTPGGSTGYDIFVMNLQRYTLEEIFSKELLFLLPFYIFSHESRFKVYNEDRRQLSRLQEEYEYIKNRLEEFARQKKIDEYTKCTLADMMNKVLEHIARKYENVREGVKSVMVGRVLEYEAKTIKREGIKEGIREGMREGRTEGRLELLCSLVLDGILSAKDAALRAKLTEDEFQGKLKEFSRTS